MFFKSNVYQSTDAPEEVLKVLKIPSPTIANTANALVGHGLGVDDESTIYRTNMNLSSYGGQTAECRAAEQYAAITVKEFECRQARGWSEDESSQATVFMHSAS
ncbi:hypothetical protein BD769DRAFT_1391406 [Suillus cothurnatus]|nr:hypothetical protein BD769DRAFT_1391406 [Suillus cothurnatus]